MATFSLSSIVLLPLLLSSAVIPAHSVRCDKNDKRTLLSIKASFGNPPALSSWNPAVGCCAWPGIGCDSDTGRVRNLTIASADLSGPIPPSIGNLTTLYYLVLYDLPGVTGPIPSSLTSIPQLYQLTISRTALSGAIPDFLGECKQLVIIRFSSNQLTGPIPDSLVALPEIFELSLNGNRLYGNLPPSLFLGYNNNPELDLSDNQFTGEVPPAYGNVDFDIINLANNQFTGDASFLMKNKSKRVSEINLSGNKFAFDMSNLELPGELVVFNLSHNEIDGSIPSSITSLDRLEVLDLSSNMLCGRIPTGGPMGQFNASSYAHNKCLCGAPLPACA